MWNRVHTKVHTTIITITTQMNDINEITFKAFLFPSWWAIKTLTANQNPPGFKEPKHLKRQRTKLHHVLIINKTLSSVGVDTNNIIILSVNKLYIASTPDKTGALQLNHCHHDQWSCLRCKPPSVTQSLSSAINVSAQSPPVTHFYHRTITAPSRQSVDWLASPYCSFSSCSVFFV